MTPFCATDLNRASSYLTQFERLLLLAIFESRPHRKERIRKGSLFAVLDSTFSRSLASRHRSYTVRSLSTCHPRHVFTSAPQKGVTNVAPFLCDGLESREFLSLYVRTIIARAIFESRPHRKKTSERVSFLFISARFLAMPFVHP